MQSASNHQVQHQPEIAFYTDGDSLADPPQFAHGAALYIRKWRVYGSKQKRTRESNALDRLGHDAWLERTDVGGDIRQLGHAYQLEPFLIEN